MLFANRIYLLVLVVMFTLGTTGCASLPYVAGGMGAGGLAGGLATGDPVVAGVGAAAGGVGGYLTYKALEKKKNHLNPDKQTHYLFGHTKTLGECTTAYKRALDTGRLAARFADGDYLACRRGVAPIYDATIQQGEAVSPEPPWTPTEEPAWREK